MYSFHSSLNFLFKNNILDIKEGLRAASAVAGIYFIKCEGRYEDRKPNILTGLRILTFKVNAILQFENPPRPPEQSGKSDTRMKRLYSSCLTVLIVFAPQNPIISAPDLHVTSPCSSLSQVNCHSLSLHIPVKHRNRRRVRRSMLLEETQCSLPRLGQLIGILPSHERFERHPVPGEHRGQTRRRDGHRSEAPPGIISACTSM